MQDKAAEKGKRDERHRHILYDGSVEQQRAGDGMSNILSALYQSGYFWSFVWVQLTLTTIEGNGLSCGMNHGTPHFRRGKLSTIYMTEKPPG
jgi:hypothetical protein